MIIASAELRLGASHSKTQQHEIHESSRAWVGNRPDSEGSQRGRAPGTGPVQISEAGRMAQSSEATAVREGIDAAANDPKMSLIRAMIAMLTGHEVKVFDASELQGTGSVPTVADPGQSSQSTEAAPPQQQPSGYGIEYDRHESYSESEQTSFAATGVVRTADGKEISFSLSLSMARSYHEESDVSIRLGDARQQKDPLVINFDGNAAQLTSQRFKFDLNSDGKTEDINFVAGGSGFLALDRNGDGKINNGSELFGAKTGDGFAELSKLDADQNGWIDENDAAYAQLRVWTKDSTGNDQLSTLKQANVGAISLASVETSFDLKDNNNALQGQIRSSGIYLQEDGRVRTVQQIDLTV
ncbi:VCBS repeat-containing protein [Candidatus Accumulibacter sp. ACC003]|uniref:VCBS repeat-containing protein n=1 Tax=Candidatus Accumulibacter sp. ACC003 TaxID=2823334 RepID=UPI0025C6F8BB|nr:VCBS repeat-containing protein [Candidatus Accumulibacter sp. ACC003]